MVLLDTNILIEILKGNTATLDRVESISTPLGISVITVMELFYGARNKAETKQLERFAASFQILHVHEAISQHATSLVRTYAKSHTLDIPDALIAATALSHRIPLMTYNTKDFRYIPNLELYPV